MQSADKTKMYPKAKLQNAPTFTRNGSHSHVCLLLVIKIKTCTYQLCKQQSADSNVLIIGRLSAHLWWVPRTMHKLKIQYRFNVLQMKRASKWQVETNMHFSRCTKHSTMPSVMSCFTQWCAACVYKVKISPERLLQKKHIACKQYCHQVKPSKFCYTELTTNAKIHCNPVINVMHAAARNKANTVHGVSEILLSSVGQAGNIIIYSSIQHAVLLVPHAEWTTKVGFSLTASVSKIKEVRQTCLHLPDGHN